MADAWIPPKSVAREAKEGLELWHLGNKKCATPVGVKRAHQLANREPISFNTVFRMYKFFNRHYKNRKNDLPRCGKTAWKLWGGDAGYTWAIDVLDSEGYFG